MHADAPRCSLVQLLAFEGWSPSFLPKATLVLACDRVVFAAGSVVAASSSL